MVFKQKEKETRERVYDLTESTQEVLKKKSFNSARLAHTHNKVQEMTKHLEMECKLRCLQQNVENIFFTKKVV